MAPDMKPHRWLSFAIATTLLWGVWGALIELPEKAGFPATLGYCVWALTMAPCALVAMRIAGWKLDRDPRSILLGSLVGFLGAGGQLLLFQALRTGPAYLVFPLVSLYPMVTVFLSVMILKERAVRRSWIGIALAGPAIVLLSYQPAEGKSAALSLWTILALIVFAAWGVQAFFMKFSNRTMSAESIFFYMAMTGLLLAPVALLWTDYSHPINWGWRGPYLAAAVQVLNSVGALCLVYALRYGKAMIVPPITALAPVLTIMLSLLLYRATPGPPLVIGMVIASVSIYLLAE